MERLQGGGRPLVKWTVDTLNTLQDKDQDKDQDQVQDLHKSNISYLTTTAKNKSYPIISFLPSFTQF